MLEHGHADARDYPIGKLLDETQIVAERRNQADGRRATLLWMALSAIPNMAAKPEGLKANHKAFLQTVKELTED